MTCAYCGHEATLRIPAAESEVCREHAIEFWTGLVAYAKDLRSASAPAEACMVGEEQDEPGRCWTSNEMSAAKVLTMAGVAVAA